jgi:hypothetical protein
MMRNRHVALLVASVLLLAPLSARAGENWRTRAFLHIKTPGLVEAVVPPELINQGQNGALDLTLTGPDDHPRAFELYWRDPQGPVGLSLKAETVRMDAHKALVWEASVPEKVIARRLRVTLSRPGTVARIDVFGRVKGKWRALVKSAAVFADAAPAAGAAGIDLPEGPYERLRLVLTGYDVRIRETLSPLRSVILECEREGRDFFTRDLDLSFRQARSEGIHVIESVLPGEGLWIDSLRLVTEARFQGNWQAGREQILAGARSFTPLLSGQVSLVDEPHRDLTMAAGRLWPARSLVVHLDAQDRYLGDVVSLSARVRLPRLVFFAEKAGRYTALSGEGGKVRIRAYPGSRYRKPERQCAFSPPETNPHWRLASLVEKYRFKGAPFDPEGYAWRAPVDISAPGYYRLALNLEAALSPRRAAVRMVRDGVQVPYVSGRTEDRRIELKADAQYDAKNNTSLWTLQLPGSSPCWKALILYATGIFKRTVSLEIPKPGINGWKTWKRAVWESRGQRETDLRLSLADLPKGTGDLRLVMPHGDNQPVTVSKISAVYDTPTVYFLADAPGRYRIYGGNPDAARPRYDLSLVQSELFSALPTEAQMGALERVSGTSWARLISDAFQGKGWGLYVVLGLVTLALVIVIVRLFPKPEDRQSP